MAYERTNVVIPDQVFCARAGIWQIAVGGKVLPHKWPDHGSAQAGLATEQRRRHMVEIEAARKDRPRVEA